MDSSLVKIDNVIAWDGQASPFCETYTLSLQDPQNEWALCLRFSFEVQPLQAQKLAVVEAFFQERSGQSLTLRQDYNLDNYDIVHADKFVEIGDCFLSLADSHGSLHDAKNSLKWECVFEDPVLSYRPYPDVFYPFSLPRYKMTYPRFLNFARGQFFINHKKYEFARIRVCQTHGHGKHLPQMVMLHAVSFAQDSDAVFALFAPRFVSQKGLLPFFACAILTMEGEVCVHQPVMTFLFKRHLRVTEDGFELHFTHRPYRFLVHLQRDPKRDFVLADGMHLNLLANLRIAVQKKRHGEWNIYKTLTSTTPVFCAQHVWV